MMGLSPAEVGSLTLWEYGAAIREWNRRQGGLPPGATKVTDGEWELFMENIQQHPGVATLQ